MNARLHVLKYLLITCLALVTLSSCGSASNVWKNREDVVKAVERVDRLYSEGKISEASGYQILANIESYESKGTIAKYWFPVVFSIVWLIWGYGTREDPQPNRTKPIDLKEMYGKWRRSLPFGSVTHELLGGSPERLAELDKRPVASFWDAMNAFSIIFPIILIWVGWGGINYYWNVPEIYFADELPFAFIVLPILAVYNFIVLPLMLPTLVGKYNAKYFRKHYEDALILADQPTPAALLVEQAQGIYATVAEEIEIAQEHASAGPDNQRELGGGTGTKVVRGIKNILSGGKQSKMERELLYLRELQNNYEVLRHRVEEIQSLLGQMSQQLGLARKAVERNLYLFTELVVLWNGAVKRNEAPSPTDVLRQQKIPMQDLSTHMNQTEANYRQTELNTDLSMDAILSGAVNVLDKLEKTDFRDANQKAEFIFEALASGLQIVVGVLSLNGDIERQRIEIEEKSGIVRGEIDKLCTAIQEYQSVILRVVEVLRALYNCNRVFVKKYTRLRDLVFQPNSSKLTEEFIQLRDRKDSKFIEELAALKVICSDYNKINQHTGIQA